MFLCDIKNMKVNLFGRAKSSAVIVCVLVLTSVKFSYFTQFFRIGINILDPIKLKSCFVFFAIHYAYLFFIVSEI